MAKAVVDAFAAAKSPLGAGATVTTDQHPTVWQVISGSDTYTLWIAFNSSALGVSVTLVGRPSIPNVIALFGEYSIALGQRAAISRIDGGGWAIDNDSENPFTSSLGYITFNLFQNASGGLDVFGSLVRIVRSTSSGTQEFHNIPCETTAARHP